MPPSMNSDPIDADLCAVLRGEAIEPRDPRAFATLAISEGVALLVWRSQARPALPASVWTMLQDEVRRQLALAAVREAELRRVLTALADRGADVLLVKGAHVGYAYYADPAMRPRHDTDLLVRPGHESRVRSALDALSYQRQPAITGASVQGQTIYDRDGMPGAVLDVHWRLSAPIAAANLFDFSELWHRAQPVPRLGGAARAPHLLDAIAIGAVHLVAHHPNERGLLWLHDLRVLANALSDDEREALVRETQSRRVSSILTSALGRSQACFPTSVGAAILAALRGDDSEPSAALLRSLAPSHAALLDVRALPGWRARTAYLAGHLFPPSDYMRRRYAPDSRAPLAWLYARRILRGAPHWLRLAR